VSNAVDLLPVVTGGLFATTVSGFLASWVSSRASGRAEKEERDRLSTEVLGPPAPRAETSLALAEQIPLIRRPPSPDPSPPPPDLPKDGDGASKQQPSDDEPEPPPRSSVYDQLLINDYALGLTQARRAFNVSMVFSVLGGLVLVLGVSLAIFRAATGGQVAGAAITSAAGVLTSGLSQLFRGQSAKALKHLETQATELRRDVRAQTNADAAQRLLGDVADVGLRGRLQAALILQFTGATLPDVGPVFQELPGGLNGAAPSVEVTEEAGAPPG
jgi:hypothetical protein